MTWAIGDVQGCFDSLEALLAKIDWPGNGERLWLCGDLVNRGPKSLEVLRWARAHDDRVVTVLGNHDLHLLAVARGLRKPREGDTLDAILAAPDRDELLAWLRRRPLLHREGRHVLVHAGLHPLWTADEAASLAAELEAQLREPGTLRALFEHKAQWSSALEPPARWGALASVLTTMRVCAADGAVDRGFKDSPDLIPPGLYPWFDVPGRKSADVTVVCGHWAALGLRVRPDLLALDTGCVWGDRLTAVRLDDGRLVQQAALEASPAQAAQ